MTTNEDLQTAEEIIEALCLLIGLGCIGIAAATLICFLGVMP